MADLRLEPSLPGWVLWPSQGEKPTECFLQKGWSVSRFVKKRFTDAFNFPLLLPPNSGGFCAPPSTPPPPHKSDATGHRPPHFQQDRAGTSWGTVSWPLAVLGHQAQPGGRRRRRAVAPFLSEPLSAEAWSPTVPRGQIHHATAVLHQACSAGGSSGPPPLGAGSPSQPYLI